MGGATTSDAATFGVSDNSFVLGTAFPQYKKLNEIQRPPPCNALLFVDESKDSIDDGYFAVELTPVWMNSPTVRHSKGGHFSFADGHSERWGWRVLAQDQDWWAPAVGASGDTSRDLRRMQDAVALP